MSALELIQDNSTRWNSWFRSIERAIGLRDRLDLFCGRYQSTTGHGPDAYRLSAQDWDELHGIHTALRDFNAATLLTQGARPSLMDWFPTLDCLLREISETKDHFAGRQDEGDPLCETWAALETRASIAWDKCHEYYCNRQMNWRQRYPDDGDLPPAYYAAQVLHPGRKWAWFRQEWVDAEGGTDEQRRWFQDAQRSVEDL